MVLVPRNAVFVSKIFFVSFVTTTFYSYSYRLLLTLNVLHLCTGTEHELKRVRTVKVREKEEDLFLTLISFLKNF